MRHRTAAARRQSQSTTPTTAKAMMTKTMSSTTHSLQKRETQKPIHMEQRPVSPWDPPLSRSLSLSFRERKLLLFGKLSFPIRFGARLAILSSEPVSSIIAENRHKLSFMPYFLRRRTPGSSGDWVTSVSVDLKLYIPRNNQNRVLTQILEPPSIDAEAVVVFQLELIRVALVRCCDRSLHAGKKR